jgi:D-galactarolactone cycloisomerase
MGCVNIAQLEVFCFRVPIDVPVATSFGIMTDRPGVFVRITDADGAFGWGEIFANWPAAGAEHRARLLMQDMADLVLGFQARGASDLFYHLQAKTHIRALQCGEWGPFWQVIAGLDCAMYDLFARRASLPVARYLNAQAPLVVPAYASGIHINDASQSIATQHARGHRAFKVKIGFDPDTDLDHLRHCTQNLPADTRLFADANQAWSLPEALGFAKATRDLPLGWIEEPLRADMEPAQWAELAAASHTPIAAGENIAGFTDFDAAIAAGHIDIFQPDIAKWGGFTGCRHVAQMALKSGKTYCPHFLGGGIGLLASAHLLAAVGGPGLLETDVNPNPLRDDFAGAGQHIIDGTMALAQTPGLGVTQLPDGILPYETLRLSRKTG